MAIVDDFTRAIWTFIMKDKTHCCTILGNFLKMVNTQFRANTKIIRIDNGTKFLESRCTDLVTSLGIIHQRSYPYTPQQNGVVERKHRHLLETVRALRF